MVSGTAKSLPVLAPPGARNTLSLIMSDSIPPQMRACGPCSPNSAESARAAAITLSRMRARCSSVRPQSRRRGADGADDRAQVVADGGADAGHARLILLAVHRMAVAPHEPQFLDEGVRAR